MAKEKKRIHQYKDIPPNLKGAKATYNLLPLEIIERIIYFLKNNNDVRTLARYLAINKAHYSQTNFSNGFWKKHALKRNTDAEVLQKIQVLSVDSNVNVKLKIAQIFTEGRQRELALQYERFKAPSPPPDPEILARDPNYANRCLSLKIFACLFATLIGFLIAELIAVNTDLSWVNTIILWVSLTAIGAVVGLIPALYPCFKECWFQAKISNVDQKLQILHQTFDEEEGEQQYLLKPI